MLSRTQDHILKAGMREFIEKGFADASLRSIAASAGVTTGAIYGYYPDKYALFRALVEPAASVFKERFIKAQEEFSLLSEAEQIAVMHSYSSDALQSLLDYVYSYFDEFKLILCSSSGTEYEEYVESLVNIEAESTKKFIEVMCRLGYHPTPLSDNLVHILSNAYFSAIFETVAHNMEKTEADEYIAHITDFFRAGWNKLLKIETDH